MVFAVAQGLLLTTAFAAEKRDFNIPSEVARLSVPAFVEQAGLSVMYELGRLDRYKTHAVTGHYEPEVALKKLLEGSGLEFAVGEGRVISVYPGKVAVSRPASVPSPTGILPTVSISSSIEPRLTQWPYGTKLLRVSSQELWEGGFTTLQDWARSLPQNEGSGASEGTHAFAREAITNPGYGSGMNLYGLGCRATLILVNGRRLAPSGAAGTFTDISNIPISAVDHIEIISDGGAALFGADAAGGIVNIVLRDARAPPQSYAMVGSFAGAALGEKQFGQSLAKAWDTGESALSLEYYSRSDLPAADRSQATSDLTAWHGTNFNSLAGNPGTLIDSRRQLWGIPAGQNGVGLSASQLLPAPNSYDRYAGTWILPHQERLSLLTSTTLRVADDWSIFLDGLANRRRFNILDGPLATVLNVPSQNPYYVNPVPGNKDPVRVLYGFGKDFGQVSVDGRVDTGQFVLGLTHEISPRWNVRGYLGYTFENQRDVEHNLANFNALENALGRNDATAFNPFADGSATDPATVAAIRTDAPLAYSSAFTYFNLETVGAVPFSPAGEMTLTLGADYRVQSFVTSVSPSLSTSGLVTTPATDRNRTVTSLFMQSSMPILRSDMDSASRWQWRFNLSSGLRYEHFSDAGQGLLPTFGFELSPLSNWTLRGTWSRLFRPPNLPDLNEAPNVSEVFPLADPSSKGGYTSALVVAGNNASLRAETAHTWSLDLVFAPHDSPNTNLMWSYFNLASSNRVIATTPLPFSVLSDPQYSYLVERNVSQSARSAVCNHSQFLGEPAQCSDPTVNAIVDLRLHNAELIRSDGFDFVARYGRDTPMGTVGANLAATYFLHYLEAPSPAGPLIEYRNTVHYPPALKLRGAFRWERHGLWVAPAVSFQSGYVDIDSLPHRSVSSWLTWDWAMGYTLSRLATRFAGETTVSLRSQNIFNKTPPFVNNAISAIGYDQENGDLLGRRISLAIQHRW